VAALLSLDGAVLLLWALVSPFRLSIAEQGQIVSKMGPKLIPIPTSSIHKQREENRLIVPELERCESEYSLAFQLAFIISKGLLMVCDGLLELEGWDGLVE
jgi:hypothetical protein